MALRVLVADDDPELLRAVVAAFEQWGAEVVSATTGDELLDRLAEGTYSLVVADISMPWMNGLSAMHSARHAGVGVPVIVITALDDAKIPERVAALGQGVVLLRKPFTPSDLESAAIKLLGPNVLRSDPPE